MDWRVLRARNNGFGVWTRFEFIRVDSIDRRDDDRSAEQQLDSSWRNRDGGIER
jgi:hypothetical protein